MQRGLVTPGLSRLHSLTLLPLQHTLNPLSDLIIPLSQLPTRMVELEPLKTLLCSLHCSSSVFGTAGGLCRCGGGLGLSVFGDGFGFGEGCDPRVGEEHGVGVALGGNLVEAAADEVVRGGGVIR